MSFYYNEEHLFPGMFFQGFSPGFKRTYWQSGSCLVNRKPERWMDAKAGCSEGISPELPEILKNDTYSGTRHSADNQDAQT